MEQLGRPPSTEKGTEVVAGYDQFYAGKAAVVKRKLGKGTVTYIGVDTDDLRLEKDISGICSRKPERQPRIIPKAFM